MFCGKCGSAVSWDDKFCPSCGSRVERNFSVSEQGGVSIITADISEIDYTYQRELIEAFERTKSDKMLLDLSKVKWIDSVGIGALVTFSYKAKKKRRQIKIVGVTDRVMQAIKILNIHKVLDIGKSRESALAEWKNN